MASHVLRKSFTSFLDGAKREAVQWSKFNHCFTPFLLHGDAKYTSSWVYQETWLNHWFKWVMINHSGLKILKRIPFNIHPCFSLSLLASSSSVPPGCLVLLHGNKEAQPTTWATCSQSWTQTSRPPQSPVLSPRWWSGEAIPLPRKPSSVTRTPWRPSILCFLLLCFLFFLSALLVCLEFTEERKFERLAEVWRTAADKKTWRRWRDNLNLTGFPALMCYC